MTKKNIKWSLWDTGVKLKHIHNTENEVKCYKMNKVELDAHLRKIGIDTGRANGKYK